MHVVGFDSARIHLHCRRGDAACVRAPHTAGGLPYIRVSTCSLARLGIDRVVERSLELEQQQTARSTVDQCPMPDRVRLRDLLRDHATAIQVANRCRLR